MEIIVATTMNALSQAARENEKRIAAPEIITIRKSQGRRQRRSLGSTSSESANASGIDMNAPNTFGSSKKPFARVADANVSTLLPGNARKRAARLSAAVIVAPIVSHPATRRARSDESTYADTHRPKAIR